MDALAKAFIPNGAVSAYLRNTLLLGTFILIAMWWQLGAGAFVSTPSEVMTALVDLFRNQQLGYELVSSLITYIQAIALSAAIALALSYSTVLPAMRPVVSFITKIRFLSLTGTALLLMLMFGGGHTLKLALLAFCIVPQIVTSMNDSIACIPREQFDLARTLRFGPWRGAWEVVIVGQRHKALEAIRQNHSIAWMMLPTVEARMRADGGIGAFLINEDRHFKLDAVYAIVILLILVGWIIDWLIARLTDKLCPYASLANERKE